MLINVLLFPFTLLKMLFSGIFGFAGWLFSFLFGLVGSVISIVISLGLIVGGIVLCATIIGSIFGIPLLVLGGTMMFCGLFRR